MHAFGRVNRVLDSRSKCLDSDTKRQSYIEVLGKLHIPHGLVPPKPGAQGVDYSCKLHWKR